MPRLELPETESQVEHRGALQVYFYVNMRCLMHLGPSLSVNRDLRYGSLSEQKPHAFAYVSGTMKECS